MMGAVIDAGTKIPVAIIPNLAKKKVFGLQNFREPARLFSIINLEIVIGQQVRVDLFDEVNMDTQYVDAGEEKRLTRSLCGLR
jgi:hypothetical protein